MSSSGNNGRNKERYQFPRWGQTAFDDSPSVVPGTGINRPPYSDERLRA